MSIAKILVVDDESDIRDLVQEILSDEGYEVSVAGSAAEARSARADSDPDLVLLDIWMPDLDGISLLKEWTEGGRPPFPVVMMSGHGTVDTAVEATRLGAYDFIEKPLSMAKLLHLVERALEEGRPSGGSRRPVVPPLLEPIGKSERMRALRDQVRRVAEHPAAVLVIGEAGTGREAFARYMHSEGRRRDGPFVSLVAGGLLDSSAQARLLGDAGTEAPKTGLLEQARGGVLFINELADLSADAQRLLVSVMEEGGFTVPGSDRYAQLDLQFITSVQPDYERRAERGEIRRDLLAQLNVVPLRIPPLREYSEDVPDLLRYYVDVLVDREGLPFRRFSVAAQNRLRNYPWPGNIRELKNMVQRLLILDGDEEIGLDEIENMFHEDHASDSESLVKQDLLSLPLREAREAFERAYLLEQLKLSDGKVGRLAERVGMERTNLYRKLRSLGIDPKSISEADE